MKPSLSKITRYRQGSYGRAQLVIDKTNTLQGKDCRSPFVQNLLLHRYVKNVIREGQKIAQLVTNDSKLAHITGALPVVCVLQ